MNKARWLWAAGTVLLASQAAAVGENVTSPDHDDHTEPPPIIRETTPSACLDGVSGGFPCKNVEMLSRITPEDAGAFAALDNWGWKDPDTGRYYALMGLNNGVGFVDITDPEAPLFLGNLPSAQPDGVPTSSGWRDLKTYQSHVFVVADGIEDHGMQVFDLTRLRGVTTPQEFEANAWYRMVGPAHNIAINEATGYAYLVGSNTCAGGLHMVDISDPAAPANGRCFTGDGYTHDAQCVIYSGPDTEHQGREICFASNEDTVSIIDVTDKNQPFMIRKVSYPDFGYVHQGWLSEDQEFFVVGDEFDELNNGINARTIVLDVRNLEAADYAGAHFSPVGSIDHNLYLKDNHVYQANYRAGLRILRANDLATGDLSEVAYFDTSPESDARAFGGAWNAYPFLDNGVLLVNDTNNGLFMLRAALPQAANQPIDGRLSGVWVTDGLEDQGINLFVGENIFGPVLYFTWFIYENGQPSWLTGSTSFEAGMDMVEVTVQRLEGLDFLSPGVDRAERTDIGTVKFHAHSCAELHVTYNLGEALGSGEMNMSSILGVEGRECGVD